MTLHDLNSYIYALYKIYAMILLHVTSVLLDLKTLTFLLFYQ